jgi:hypothetical protein
MTYQSDFRIAADKSWNMEKVPELMNHDGDWLFNLESSSEIRSQI